MLAATWSGNDIIYLCSIGALIVAFYQIGSKRSEEKRRRKIDAEKVKAIADGKEKAASEKLEGKIDEAVDGIRSIKSVVFDRPPSDEEPEGHKGILSTQITQGRLLSKVAQRQGISATNTVHEPEPVNLDPHPSSDTPDEGVEEDS